MPVCRTSTPGEIPAPIEGPIRASQRPPRPAWEVIIRLVVHIARPYAGIRCPDRIELGRLCWWHGPHDIADPAELDPRLPARASRPGRSAGRLHAWSAWS